MEISQIILTNATHQLENGDYCIDLRSISSLFNKSIRKIFKTCLLSFIDSLPLSAHITLIISNKHPSLIKFAIENEFFFENSNYSFSTINMFAREHIDGGNKVSTLIYYKDISLYSTLLNLTQVHIQYLKNIGFGERSNEIKISRFNCNQLPIDISLFEQRVDIPQEVIDFDSEAPNTLITVDPITGKNNQNELQKILDIRLYPVLRDLIKNNSVEVFLGMKGEMVTYYANHGWKILYEFQIPSSARYYLAQSLDNNYLVIMSGLVGKDNLIAQLLTLKLANITETTIIGNISSFQRIIQNDINILRFNIPEITDGNKILIVAGCGLETQVSNLIRSQYELELGESKIFKGDVISLIYIPFLQPRKEIVGIISLHLNYGEIMETIIQSFLNEFHCTHIFTGGACGYVPINNYRPEIGTRIPISRSINNNGELIEIGDSSMLNVQIPSIFLETYEWLNKVRKFDSLGLTVDIETFYILRAIRNYNLNHPERLVIADCGCFISDYIEEQPLRDYSKVFTKYNEVLVSFLDKTILNN